MVWSGGEAQIEYMERRLKREDCKHTKHDSLFSKWEILIGPNDWEDHASGKDGVERYRIHNLPTASSCSGLYELGVASIPSTDGHKLRKLEWENAVVVYLGQADNVRTRLQEYGRSGSHLELGNLVSCWKNYESSSPGGGQGLFKDIFSKGFSIMFRWAPIKSKMEAEKTEIKLLRIFDYAWNRKGNGACRHGEILKNLIHNSSNSGYSPLRRLLQWKEEAFSKRVGININAFVPPFEELTTRYGFKGYLLPQIFKFSSSQLQCLPRGVDSVNDKVICGVATGHGSICINQPLPGRRRCAEHKGKKITGSGSASRRMTSSSDIILEDETKGCELINPRRITSPPLDEICSPFQQNQSQLAQEKFHHEKEKNDICGVIYGDGSVCTVKPVLGRKRCERHKGQRVLAAMPSLDKMFNSPLDEICSPFQQNQSQLAQEKFHHEKEKNDICGVIYGDGSVCTVKPGLGRKRCERHKGQRVLAAMPSVDKMFNSLQLNNICGVISGNGASSWKKEV